MSEAPDPVAEGFRRLRTALLLTPGTPPLRRIAAVGVEPAGPTAAVVAQLARALAAAGGRVVAVDCDLRAPQLHQRFGLGNETGLADLLRNEAQPQLQPLDTPAGELRLLPAGTTQNGDADLLASDRFGEILNHLLETADHVVLSGPPVTEAADAAVVAARADAVLLVLQAGRTSRQTAQRAVTLLKQVKAPLIGAVLASPQ